jgi:glucokinase
VAKNDGNYVGIDLGGTNIQCGVYDSAKGKLLYRDGTKTKSSSGADAVVKRIVKLTEKVVDDSGLKMKDMAGLGIGAPGAVDIHKGMVLRAVNLGWTDFPLAKALNKETGLPVVLDNDVNVGAWGEFKAGAAKDHHSCFAIFVGTGVGGGLIFNGQLYHGDLLTAGEVGHTVIKAGNSLGRRTVENLASRTSMVNQIIQLVEAGKPSVVSELTDGDWTSFRSKVLAQAYRKEDEITREVVHAAAQVIGVTIANVVTLLSLPCVVVGGGATEALGKPWMERIRSVFRENVFPEQLQQCVVAPSVLEDDAGVIGAALLARDRIAGDA